MQRHLLKYVAAPVCWLLIFSCSSPTAPSFDRNVFTIKKSADFEISGDGTAENWNLTEWVPIGQRRGKDTAPRSTKAKILYSETGIYFLFFCEDSLLTSTLAADNLRLWEEDVVEIFLAPDPGRWDHFEYELSPLNYELALFVTQQDRSFIRWSPYYYQESDRERTIHATGVVGGEKQSLATVSGWTAEFYVPYRLLTFFDNVPPRPGMQWRGNLYRVDYDRRPSSDWTWQPVSGSYHNTDEYGMFLFE